jgi:hypothetical protein
MRCGPREGMDRVTVPVKDRPCDEPRRCFAFSSLQGRRVIARVYDRARAARAMACFGLWIV